MIALATTVILSYAFVLPVVAAQRTTSAVALGVVEALLVLVTLSVHTWTCTRETSDAAANGAASQGSLFCSICQVRTKPAR